MVISLRENIQKEASAVTVLASCICYSKLTKAIDID